MRSAKLDLTCVAIAAVLAAAGVAVLDTGAVQRPAAVRSELQRPHRVIPEDWFTLAATGGSPDHDRDSLVEMRSPVRTANTRTTALQSVAALAESDGQLEDSALSNDALGQVDPAVREEAVHALGARGGSISLQTLQQALQDPSSRVRDAAIRALISIGGDEAVLTLGPVVNTGDVSMRLAAMDALGAIGGTDASRYLEPMLQDENAVIREAAAEWLAELSTVSY